MSGAYCDSCGFNRLNGDCECKPESECDCESEKNELHDALVAELRHLSALAGPSGILAPEVREREAPVLTALLNKALTKDWNGDE